jgi:hypothetical protein
MRNMQCTLLLCWSCLVGCATSSRTTVVAAGDGTVSTDVFVTALAPYGEWVDVGTYGRVWRPSPAVVGVGFRPYGPGGHWVHTDYGWSYESDWAWGWAPFHYGRWYLDQGHGWVWIPGNAWAPAWVSWRYGGGYVGWAPLPPVGSAIVIEARHPYWCFVETRYLVVRDVYHYAMPVQNYHVAFSATATVQQTMSHGSTSWSPGPPAAQVSREIGQPIHTASVTPPPVGAVQAHRISPTPAHAGAPSGTPAHSSGSSGAQAPAAHPAPVGAATGHPGGGVPDNAAHGEEAHRGDHAQGIAHGEAERESHIQTRAPPPPPPGKRRRR